MRRVGGLFSEIVSFGALVHAAKLASRGKRHRPDVARLLWDLEAELLELQGSLVEGTWRPGRLRRFTVHDPKEREISVAPFRDRVVHHALCAQAGPVLERGAIHHSYACRVGKGAHAAVAQCRKLVCARPFFLKCDVRHFFATVDHEILKGRLRRVLKDRRVLDLFDAIIDAGAEGTRGLPIGNLTSQHLANFYLTGLDHHVLERLRPRGYLRYMDDFVLFEDDRPTLRIMLREIRRFLRDSLRLELNESATLSHRTAVGLPFLGLRIYPGALRLRRRRVRRFGLMLRKRLAAAAGDDLLDARLQASLGSIIGHAAMGSSPGFRRRVLESVSRSPPG